MYLIIDSLEPQPDIFDEYIRKGALFTGILGMVLFIYSCIDLFCKSKKQIHTKIYNFYLEADSYKNNNKIFNMNVEIETIKLDFDKNLQVEYSFIPINGKAKTYNTKNIKFNEKFENIIIFPLILTIKIFYIILFFILSCFKFKKYYIFKNEDYVISVKANKELESRFGRVGFEFLTLTCLK